MTTQTEVLKLALEALENLINQHYAETTTNDDLEKADNAITAIKEALAQPAVAEQHKQEPVAWVIECEEYNSAGERPVLREIDYYSHIVDQLPAGTKLYTTPPTQQSCSQRPSRSDMTWVGLTDEEVITMSRYDLEYAALIGEVQRKLKEKNT